MFGLGMGLEEGDFGASFEVAGQVFLGDFFIGLNKVARAPFDIEGVFRLGELDAKADFVPGEFEFGEAFGAEGLAPEDFGVGDCLDDGFFLAGNGSFDFGKGRIVGKSNVIDSEAGDNAGQVFLEGVGHKLLYTRLMGKKKNGKFDLALKVENLTVELGGQRIIENLSFEVRRGETLVVLGPNGAGKTTLLRALLGIIPYEGRVEWAVRNTSYLPPNELLQRKEMLPLTVVDFYGLKKVKRAVIKESLESVGLSEEIIGKRVAELSTGQFQRLSVAWALVDKPDTLLFDEPTSGIDIGGAETIYSLLHKFWKKQGLTIILVTHDLSVVWEHADNVLCLNKKGLCYGVPTKALTTKNLRELYGVGVKYYQHREETL